MCGIFFLKSNVNNKLINEKTADLIYASHKDRGPDETNRIIQNNWMMVHTRLSITSPESGHQPIYNKSKKVYMVFNGEIYNYKSLVDQFNLNFTKEFKYSDTDVLFKLIEKIGFVETLKNIRGMFAIIYYNLSTKKIYIARDHFGQKPIWIYERDGLIAISSTIKSIVELFKPDVQNTNLIHLISKQGKTCPSKSVYKFVSGLRAGQLIEIDNDLNKKTNYFFSYKNLIDIDIYKKNCNSTKSNLDQAIRETIKLHCDTESSLGVLLSGGYDSSMIYKYAFEFNSPLICFTKLCPNIEKIPLDVIPKLINKFPSDITFKVITPTLYLIGLFDFIKHNLDVPKWGGTSTMRTLLKESKNKGIKVLLGGDGIDESMLGYNTHFNHIEKRSDNLIHSVLAGEVFLKEFCEEDNFNLINLRESIEESLGNYMNTDEAFTKSFLYQDTLEFLQRCNLPSADLFSMNQSIELRNPFVDIEFLRNALNTPLSFNCVDNLNGKLVFKDLAKEVIGDIFPSHKEGTRNYSKLLCNSDFWRLDEFEVMREFPILRSFNSFQTNTKFTIISCEILLRIINNPELEIIEIYELLTLEGKKVFHI